MKWEKYMLLLFDAADYDVRETANRWKRRYCIPDNMCFATPGLENYTKFAPGCLRISDQDTKILVMCHGSADSLEIAGRPYKPQMVGSTLFHYGLRRAGLLALKGCELGKKSYLEDLAAALRGHGVLVDWLVGYRDWIRQLDLKHIGVGTLDSLVRNASRGCCKLPDDYRIKVIQGHVGAAARAGSRRYA
jgi:hypothetical protein